MTERNAVVNYLGTHRATWVVATVLAVLLVLFAVSRTGTKVPADTAKPAADTAPATPATPPVDVSAVVAKEIKPIVERMDRNDARIAASDARIAALEKPASPSVPFKPVDAKPAVAPPKPKPIPVEVIVADSILLQDLDSTDVKNVAYPAALDLVSRIKSIEEKKTVDTIVAVVNAYAAGESETKKRTVWVLSHGGEPVRQWFNRVLNSPKSYRPCLSATVREIIGTFEESDADAKAQACAEEIIRAIQESQAKQEEMTKAIKGLQDELDNLKVEHKKAASVAHRTHNAAWQKYAYEMRDYVQKMEARIAEMEKEKRQAAQAAPRPPAAVPQMQYPYCTQGNCYPSGRSR